MSNAFIRKLECFAPLSTSDRHDVETLIADLVPFEAHEDIAPKGARPDAVDVVMSGWACSHKTLPDGRRQILSLLLPGDVCDPYAFLPGIADHGISTLTPCSMARVPVQPIRDLMAGRSSLTDALWWQVMVASEVQREWTISLGRRTALERLAHLFCEVLARLAAVGQSNGATCDWPLTQTDLAEATGISTVHVNRNLQELRTAGLIELRKRHLVVRDRRRLAGLAMFDPAYLHLRRG